MDDNKKAILNIVLSFVSGLLMVLAFPPFGLSFLAWVSLIPLLVVIKNSGLKGAFFYSYLSGIVFFCGLIYWLVNVTVPGTIVLVAFLALFFAVFGVISGIMIRTPGNVVLIPLVWCVLEYLRSIVLTGFPWGFLSYSQYRNIPLIQISDITGSYGVSFLIVAFNTAVFAFLMRLKGHRAYLIMVLVFVLASGVYGYNKMGKVLLWGKLRVSLVQGNIPQKLKWNGKYAKEIIRKYSFLTAKAAELAPDLIIWPETAYPYVVDGDFSKVTEISGLAKETGIPILSGLVFSKDGKYYNSAALFDDKGDAKTIYSKTHLVPFGEYIPFRPVAKLVRGFVNKPIGDFSRGKKNVIFSLKKERKLTLADGAITREKYFYKLGVLICFEDIFPSIARRAVKKGADFLVNITNDAWFGKSAAPQQHLQASVFRAVENRVPVLRATNTGISCFIDSRGRISNIVNNGGKDIFVSGIATADVGFGIKGAFYTYYGDIFTYISFAFLILMMFAQMIAGPGKGWYSGR